MWNKRQWGWGDKTCGQHVPVAELCLLLLAQTHPRHSGDLGPPCIAGSTHIPWPLGLKRVRVVLGARPLPIPPGIAPSPRRFCSLIPQRLGGVGCVVLRGACFRVVSKILHVNILGLQSHLQAGGLGQSCAICLQMERCQGQRHGSNLGPANCMEQLGASPGSTTVAFHAK